MAEEEFSGTGISVTVKGSEAFDAPWIVIHARSVAEARQMMLELSASDLMQGTAAVAASFQSHFQQKPRYQGKSGSGNSGRSTTSSGSQPAPAPSPSAAASSPPPAFVPQNAQPADWGTPVQQLQQNLGAVVEVQAPNEVNVCRDCGGGTQYAPPGVNSGGRKYSASFRCPQRGHGSWWFSDRDNAWNWAASRR